MQLIINGLVALSATHCVIYDFAYLFEHELSQLPSFRTSTLLAAFLAFVWVMLRERKRSQCQ